MKFSCFRCSTSDVDFCYGGHIIHIKVDIKVVIKVVNKVDINIFISLVEKEFNYKQQKFFYSQSFFTR